LILFRFEAESRPPLVGVDFMIFRLLPEKTRSSPMEWGLRYLSRITGGELYPVFRMGLTFSGRFRTRLPSFLLRLSNLPFILRSCITDLHVFPGDDE